MGNTSGQNRNSNRSTQSTPRPDMIDQDDFDSCRRYDRRKNGDYYLTKKPSERTAEIMGV